MASSKEETYCLCGQPYTVGQFMIECDCCREWFHGSCVNVRIYQSDDIDKYHCPKCSQTYGPSILKQPTNNHRQDRYEVGAETKLPQVGSPTWIASLARRPPRPRPNAIIRMHPSQFTEDFVKDNGFVRPIFFNTIDGLNIQIPNPSSFTVRSVLRLCGPQMEVEIIDVRKQSNFRMSLGEFVDYFESPPMQRDGKVLNVISLEFTETTMKTVVHAPGIVRALDWARICYPQTAPPPRPQVAHYCLISPAGAYTDFHVDFGGTSVWYHVLHGKKIFYLMPPTSTNLALYQQWNTSHNQSEKFFGDMCEWYTTIEVNAGETLFIPGGWIHAVFTPEDSLVFGGNFLHSYAIEMQLQINEIEQKVETPLHFRYPLFETMNWYAAKHLLTLLTRYNDDRQDEDFAPNESWQWSLPALLIRGLKILAPALKEWHALKATIPQKKSNIPGSINSSQLVRDLFKELKRHDKLSTQTKPEKPKDPTFKTSSSKSKKKKSSHSSSQLKPLKLTLPKPIMHNISNNGDYQAVAGKSEPYFDDNRVYLEEKQPPYVQEFERKNTVLRMKLGSYPSSSKEELPPPPYSAQEHSILKSHLIGDTNHHLLQKQNQNQWTISKHGEQEQTLFTNDNLQTMSINYGPGMYSVEDVQNQTYYHEPQKYAPDYSNTSYQEIQPPMYHPQTVETYIKRDPVTMHHNSHLAQLPAHHHLQQQHQQQEMYAPSPQPAQHQVVPTLPPYESVLAAAHNVPYAPGTPTSHQDTSKCSEKSNSGGGGVRRSERAVRRRHSPSYHYDSDTPLYIDENPTPLARTKAKKTPLVYPRSVPNGIESLIQASQLASPTRFQPETVAVDGMLSICGQPTTSTPISNAARKAKPRDFVSSDEEMLDDAEVVKAVHKDDEYVYPSLEMSSDEDEYDYSKSRRRSSQKNESKKDKDESWSPRARVGRLLPRSRRPHRSSGVRRENVRAALKHAAEHVPAPQPQAVKPVKSKPAKAAVATAPVAASRPVQAPAVSAVSSKPKKGLKTAKQRLGKILKIHKMRL